MDKMLRLLALDAVKGITTEQEKIELLDSLGFRPIEIAGLLNKTPDNINVQLNIIRKKKTGKQTKATEQTQTPKTNGESAEVAVNLSKTEENRK